MTSYKLMVRPTVMWTVGSIPAVMHTNYNVDVLRELVDTLERQGCNGV